MSSARFSQKRRNHEDGCKARDSHCPNARHKMCPPGGTRRKSHARAGGNPGSTHGKEHRQEPCEVGPELRRAERDHADGEHQRLRIEQGCQKDLRERDCSMPDGFDRASMSPQTQGENHEIDSNKHAKTETNCRKCGKHGTKQIPDRQDGDEIASAASRGDALRKPAVAPAVASKVFVGPGVPRMVNTVRTKRNGSAMLLGSDYHSFRPCRFTASLGRLVIFAASGRLLALIRH
jgi:hypothetical protein